MDRRVISKNWAYFRVKEGYETEQAEADVRSGDGSGAISKTVEAEGEAKVEAADLKSGRIFHAYVKTWSKIVSMLI